MYLSLWPSKRISQYGVYWWLTIYYFWWVRRTVKYPIVLQSNGQKNTLTQRYVCGFLNHRQIKPWNNVNFTIIFSFKFIFFWLRHLLTQRIIIFATKIDKDMSKQVEQMRRMLLILNNIKQRQRISKQELLSRVNDRLYWIYGYKEIGVRTLERDLEDIESMFCVSITYDRSNN